MKTCCSKTWNAIPGVQAFQLNSDNKQEGPSPRHSKDVVSKNIYTFVWPPFVTDQQISIGQENTPAFEDQVS